MVKKRKDKKTSKEDDFLDLDFGQEESEDTDDLERWIILTELLGTYGLLALTGYVPSFLQKKYNEMVKKRKKYKSNERRKKK